MSLWKLSETADEVEYTYGPDRAGAGLLAVSKTTGAVRNIRSVAGYSEADSEFLFLQLAAAKAQMLQQSGVFPDEAALSA